MSERQALRSRQPARTAAVRPAKLKSYAGAGRTAYLVILFRCYPNPDYRTFRVDGISTLEVSDERYDERERTLAGYFAAALDSVSQC